MAIITQYQCDATGEIFQKQEEIVAIEIAVYTYPNGYRKLHRTVQKLLSVKKAEQLGLLLTQVKEDKPEVQLTFGQQIEALMRKEMQDIADDAAAEAVFNSRN